MKPFATCAHRGSAASTSQQAFSGANIPSICPLRDRCRPFASCSRNPSPRQPAQLLDLAGQFHTSSPISGQNCCTTVRGRSSIVTKASTETEADREEELQVEGIDRAYCDEFVCTSSPQVEQNVKALARDVTRLTTWTSGLFRKDVKYKDAFLSFTGVEKHQRLLFPRDCMSKPKVLVTKLSMLDRGRCQVDWRLRGSIAVFPIDVDFSSEFGLDLITGRVNMHNERWDLSRLSPPSKLAFTASRIAWSLKLRGQGLKDQSAQLIEKWKPKNENEGNITQDMNDPTKFFQDEDPSKDLFAIGAIIAFIYFIFQAYSEISKLK